MVLMSAAWLQWASSLSERVVSKVPLKRPCWFYLLRRQLKLPTLVKMQLADVRLIP